MAKTGSTQVALALLALYVIWGTTYFGIREAVLHIPPLSMAAIRFLAPGAVLYAVLRARGAEAPSSAAWGRAALVGGLMLTIGNGVVSFVETGLPSGVTALIVATVPLWVSLFEWHLERRTPGLLVGLGLGLGIAGVATLSAEDAGWGPAAKWWWVPMLVASSGCWGLGSILSRRPWPRPSSAWLDLGMQMLAAGFFLVLGAAAKGELAAFDPAAVPASAWLWVLYLSLFGSVVALGCYLWLLRVTSPALATTYAFVNPVVAVFVGAVFAHEPVTGLTLAGAAVIVAAVALIIASKARSGKPSARRGGG